MINEQLAADPSFQYKHQTIYCKKINEISKLHLLFGISILIHAYILLG